MYYFKFGNSGTGVTLASYLILCLAIWGCNSPQTHREATTIAEEEPETTDQVVEIFAEGLTLQAPDSIPSGWNNFRFDNPTNMVHMIIIARYPDGKGIKEHQDTLAPIFQNVMDQINGKELSVPELGTEVPAWYGDIQFLGGPGLLSPGNISETMINLTPGTYVLECYVKTNGIFHSYNADPEIYGMVHQMTVTGEASNIQPPEASLSVVISSENGIQLDGNPTTGEQWVEVNMTDQKVYENFLGHDIHLVKMADETDISAVGSWMNWANPQGLETPAPAEFLGGANDMPVGNKAYFKIDLEPGSYAWVAEIPDPASHNMLLEFTVGGDM